MQFILSLVGSHQMCKGNEKVPLQWTKFLELTK